MTFLSGCDALARGAWEGGADFVGSYPGSPVVGITDCLARFPEIKTRLMVNEKVAMEVAVGVAHAGQRALVVIKHVGLNVAADPFFNVAYTGTRGALVVIVGDDPGAKSSQNEQDTRMLASAANVPVLEPTSVQEALIFTKLAFEISERFDIPVIVRVTTPLCYGTSKVVTGTRQLTLPQLGFAKPVQKYLLLPAFVVARHRDLNARLGRLATSHWNRWFSQVVPANHILKRYDYGIVIAGFPYAQVAKVFRGHVPILKLGMSFPLHKAVIHEFAAYCDKLLVVEESSGFIEHQLRTMGLKVASRPSFDGAGEFSLEQMLSPEIPAIAELLAKMANDPSARQNKRIPIATIAGSPHKNEDLPLKIPPRPPGLCAGCSHRGIFRVLAQRALYVVGDIGCYTLGALEPYRALHTNLCMGASIGMLQGYITAMGPQAAHAAIAVIGDSTFFHSGMPSLLAAAVAEPPLTMTVLILDNHGPAMTGHQAIVKKSFGGRDWERLLGALGVPEFAVVDALDLRHVNTILDAFLASNKLSVMVLQGDCVQGLHNKVPTNYRYTIQTDICTRCADCLKLDCPAIVPAWGQGRNLVSVSINKECTACGLCPQVCPARAIMPYIIGSWCHPVLIRMLPALPWRRIINKLRSIKVISHLLDFFERETH